MIKYHDEEWGVPVHDDRLLFEYMILDAFQAGLSWRTVLYKRENFRKAFDNFNPELHKQQFPSNIWIIRASNLKIVNYGFSSEKLIKEKYERYKSMGQTGFALDRLNPDTDTNAELEPINEEWLK